MNAKPVPSSPISDFWNSSLLVRSSSTSYVIASAASTFWIICTYPLEARAQLPIFDTYHTNGIFVNCGYLDIVTLLGGSLKHKQGIFGYCIALSTFDNDYLLRNIHEYSITAYINMRPCEICVLILVEY